MYLLPPQGFARRLQAWRKLFGELGALALEFSA